MGQDKRYTPDEVTAIVANALRRQRDRVDISHEELLETAAELGIPPGEVEEAARHLSTERDMEWARDKWLERERAGWRWHVVSFVVVNTFLMAVDLMTGHGTWFMWPLLGWGMGLAFHTYAIFFPDPDQMDKGALEILAAKQRTRPTA
ncbi:MAG: 2TM domain-containing protein [FCB group bacterium]|jgi:hypothetical protein|nr:2TM domain-containing protein [FCB group bacterium]